MTTEEPEKTANDRSTPRTFDLNKQLLEAALNKIPQRENAVFLENIHNEENESQDYDNPPIMTPVDYSTTTLIKRTHLKNLIYEIYEMENENKNDTQTESVVPEFVVQGYVDKLPPGKNLKNSILLAWKRRYFRLNSIGVLYVYDIDENGTAKLKEPIEMFNLMGGRVMYEQAKVISLDDCKGSYLVFRACEPTEEESAGSYQKWKSAIDTQIIDRIDSLWVRPNKSLTLDNSVATRKLSNKVF